jgi:mono/diheme cytochrome c family protein
MFRFVLPIVCTAMATLGLSAAQEASFPPEKVRNGAETYALNCSPCHGPRLYGEESAFDLRTLTPDQRERFIASVTNGKNQMPPWGGLLKPEEIEALWAYVIAGER